MNSYCCLTTPQNREAEELTYPQSAVFGSWLVSVHCVETLLEMQDSLLSLASLWEALPV